MVGATVRILANTPLRMDQVGMARPAGLDHRFAEQREARGDLETAARGHSNEVGMARPAGLEPATSWFVARRSIQLS